MTALVTTHGLTQYRVNIPRDFLGTESLRIGNIHTYPFFQTNHHQSFILAVINPVCQVNCFFRQRFNDGNNLNALIVSAGLMIPAGSFHQSELNPMIGPQLPQIQAQLVKKNGVRRHRSIRSSEDKIRYPGNPNLPTLLSAQSRFGSCCFLSFI